MNFDGRTHSDLPSVHGVYILESTLFEDAMIAHPPIVALWFYSTRYTFSLYILCTLLEALVLVRGSWFYLHYLRMLTTCISVVL